MTWPFPCDESVPTGTQPNSMLGMELCLPSLRTMIVGVWPPKLILRECLGVEKCVCISFKVVKTVVKL
jgi:hypothetical protein